MDAAGLSLTVPSESILFIQLLISCPLSSITKSGEEKKPMCHIIHIKTHSNIPMMLAKQTEQRGTDLKYMHSHCCH